MNLKGTFKAVALATLIGVTNPGCSSEPNDSAIRNESYFRGYRIRTVEQEISRYIIIQNPNDLENYISANDKDGNGFDEWEIRENNLSKNDPLIELTTPEYLELIFKHNKEYVKDGEV